MILPLPSVASKTGDKLLVYCGFQSDMRNVKMYKWNLSLKFGRYEISTAKHRWLSEIKGHFYVFYKILGCKCLANRSCAFNNYRNGWSKKLCDNKCIAKFQYRVTKKQEKKGKVKIGTDMSGKRLETCRKKVVQNMAIWGRQSPCST